jgi:hypothetical protein
MNIKEILARRSDLSTFLVHLSRDREGMSARDALESILSSGRLEAGEPLGLATAKLKTRGISTESQRVVCFTETPLEHLSLLLEPIENRQQQFKPYGIALTKKAARRRSVNPVWYIDATPRGGGDAADLEWLTIPLNQLVDDVLTGAPEAAPILKLTPFFDLMGTWPSGKREFWWEREWRHVGNLILPEHVIALCPEEDFDHFTKLVLENSIKAVFIDPRWSLERTIAHLAGVPASDVNIL